MWAPLLDIYIKFKAFITTMVFRVMISIDLITTLANVGCYILLLPVCKGWNVGEKVTFLTGSDDFLGCGWHLPDAGELVLLL